ncbi:hypothetical protein ACNKHR_29770 [Shigella flexneri]
MTHPIQASLNLQALKQNCPLSASHDARARLVVVKANATGMVLSVSGARWGHRWLCIANLEGR